MLRLKQCVKDVSPRLQLSITDHVQRLHIYGLIEAAVDDPIESSLHNLAWKIILGSVES